MREIIKSAFKQLGDNKLRTFLTMLGMFIGIAAVIIILSVGEGLKGYVQGQFAGVGKGTVQVSVSTYQEEDMITKDDIEVIKSLPQVKEVMPAHHSYTGETKDYEKNEKILLIYGVGHNMDDYYAINLKYGRMFTQVDQDLRNNVLVVGEEFSKIVYKRDDPKYALGKSVDVTIKGQTQTFEIIGISKSEYPASTPEEYIMPVCYLPFETADSYLFNGEGRSYTCYVIIGDGYEPKDYTSLINRVLEKQHGKKDIFNVKTMVEQADEFNSIVNTLNLFVSLVAAVSLLVGGIGIMNIMLVTVRERTREIGIRKALGATDRQILTQFLIEALILTFLGGLTGLVLGYLGGIGLTGILRMATSIELETQMTGAMIAFSVGSSSFVGIVFGVYPAYKAAKLDPVEALRQD